MFAGLGGTSGPDDEMKKSYISDIRNFFTKSIKGGAVGGGISSANTIMLAQEDQKKIRIIFNKIDEVLTRECFYCGGILIDMIDNDVFIASGD